MKNSKQFFAITVVLVVSLFATVSGVVLASEYKVVFTEGAYNFDSNLQLDDLNNKYLATIEVFIDGKSTDSDIRGSTISDSIFYYQMWNVDGRSVPPNDDDIVDIFSNWEQKTQRWNVKSKCGQHPDEDIVNIFSNWGQKNIIIPHNGILNDFLSSMRGVIDYMVYVPVIWSGKYRFEIGQHKNGNSIHGQPYVLKLKGTRYENQPYNAKDKINEKDLLKKEGTWISTINKNRAQNMNCITSGINIHRGRRSKDYKDSEGCLTIHPDDWGCFIRIFPCIKDWKIRGHEGIVEVIRSNTAIEKPGCPPPPALVR